MKLTRLLLVTGLSLTLTACGHWHHNKMAAKQAQPTYAQQAQVTSPVRVPSDMSTAKIKNYYPVPKAGDSKLAAKQDIQDQSILIMPPGSKVAEKAKQDAAKSASASKTKSVRVAKTKKIHPVRKITLPMSFNKAWIHVGKALHASGYQIMQQDKSMGAYFVLDLAGTNGHLEKATPIYQVQLHRRGKKTTVTLANERNAPANITVSTRILTTVKRHV